MKFKLKSLHRNGTALTPEELADTPRHVGSLIVEDCPQEGAVGRPIRQARLLDMSISQASSNTSRNSITRHGQECFGSAFGSAHTVWLFRAVERKTLCLPA